MMLERLRRRQFAPQPADRLARVVQEVLGLDDNWMTDGRETPLLGAVPQLDSMAAVALLAELEREFDVRIADEDVGAEMFTTFGDLLSFIEARMPGPSKNGRPGSR